VHLFSIRNDKPTDVTILFVYCWISTCFGPTCPSSGEFTQLFPQPLVQYPYRSGRVFCMYNIQNTRPERYGYWTNGCGNSCVNSPEDGPVGPKHVEIRRHMNKIETVTSVGFLFLNPLNPELNPICYLLALLAHHFLHVSRIRVKSLTIRLLMSYIYGVPILDVSRSYTTTHHSR